MQGYTNLARIRLYAKISRVLAFGGLGLMGVAVLISLRQPYPVDVVFGLLLVGMVASQIGLPLRNRWDREPRLDQVLDENLKGLDKRYLVFHHFLGASHVLICPAGVYALIPRMEDGKIELADGKWQRTVEKRGLLRRGGTKQIRGLKREISGTVERARRWLRRMGDSIEVHPLLVFVHSEAVVPLEGTPIATTHIKKLKQTLRKLPKGQTLSDEQLAELKNQLGLEK